MKARIRIDSGYINGDYSGISEVFEWNLPLPVKGDYIDLSDEMGSLIKMIYESIEDKEAIEDNYFEYKHKDYICINGEIIVEFNFGDCDE